MKLLLDEQHDRHVAELLRREGHDIVAVTEIPEQRGLPDRALLEAAASMRRAIVTENAADFAVLHRQFIGAGRTHYGIVLTSARRFAGPKAGRRAFLSALRSLLRAHPPEDALRDQLVWLDR